MRLKIKQVQQPSPPEPDVQQQNQKNLLDLDITMMKEAIKEEEEDDKGNGCGLLVPDGFNDSTDLSPTTPSVPQGLGKRKRKPKELIDEISPIFFRCEKKKKKPSGLGKLDGGGNKASKREKAADEGSGPFVPLKSPTVIRAEEFLSSLGNEYPSFMKVLVRSHVGSCFWMGLPVPFCKTHLPKKDTQVVLENENGEQWEIKYITAKTGLSAGWRKFVAAQKLVEGDVLVFQLIGPITFKVYVIRANDLNEVDGALSLLDLETLTKQNDAEGAMALVDKKKKRKKSLPLTVVQKKKQKAGLSKYVVPHLGQLEEQSGNDSDEVASEVLESTKFSGDTGRFRDIKSFEDFHILVNGVCIDSELPEDVRRKYYELCCSKDAFLHERFLPGLHCKLAAGIIFEAVDTIDAMRACKVTTSREEFEKWEKSLQSFEILGMNVGFLSTRLHRLQSLAFDAEGALETKRYWEAKTKRTRNVDEIKNLESKLQELKETCVKYDADIEMLRSKAESYEQMFQVEVNAPW